MNADEMYAAAKRCAAAAEASANGNFADAKQILHMALTVVHCDENRAREAEKAKAAKMPGRPR